MGDGGPATSAALGNTNGLLLDTAGNLIVSSSSGIRQITPDGIIHTLGGTPCCFAYAEAAPANTGGISGAQGLALDSLGDIYLADFSNNAIRVLQPFSGLKIVNAASNDPNSYPAPGEIVVLYGANLGPTNLVTAAPDASGFYPTQLAGTRVLFAGIPAPVLYTSANQVAAIVPYEILMIGNPWEAVVEYQGNAAATQTSTQSLSVGIFTLDSSGKGQAAAVNQDGSINGPLSPAHPGDIISLFATGEGQTSPGGVDGKLDSLPLPKPMSAVTAYVGGLSAIVQYAGGAYGEVAGLMQVNVQIPAGVGTGNSVPIQIYVGGWASQTGATIAVH